jgi:hypothetical protein
MQNMSPDCHLSFVVTTRNDNHGGDMLRRFQIFAENLLEQANRHSLSGELIVVEWNPPSGSRAQEYTLRPPAKIYHMEHHNSWVVMTPDERLRAFTKKPWIDIGLLSELWDNMYRTNRPIRFNTEDWGLAGLDLE